MNLVYCPGNGKTITEITIRASDIIDLVEAPLETAENGYLQNENLRPPEFLQQPAPPKLSKPKTFEDPAILSMGRRPPSQVLTPSPGPIMKRAGSLRAMAIPVTNEIPPTAVLVEAMSKLGLPNGEEDGNAIGSDGEAQTLHNKKPRARRRPRKGGRGGAANAQDGDDDFLKTTPAADTNNSKTGWRQTPLLEPNPSFQPFSTLKKTSKGRGKTYDNGWATEEATDVQDMGDFDFESNLSKFDKRTVFEGIRAEDVTADEDRLVGHNRLAKPGTAGGKNLHPTENVLDTPGSKPVWNSEAGDSEAEGDLISQRDTGSGRNSRRAHSRLRNPTLRKESIAPPQLTRSVSKQMNEPAKSSFYILPENRRCDTISALQMLNLENIADSEFGLTEDMMAENAGRGIAELIISAAAELGWKSSTPHVVVIAGNNKSGMRAVSGGRHLRNHGLNVVVCVLGLERETELFPGLRRQLKVFRSFGGKIFTKIELLDYMKNLDSSIDFIIDGLLGLTISFEELRTGDQATAYELIEWANRSGADVMAIDIPTGIDPSSGKVSIIDGKPLYIHPAFVVAMGAPKKGLLQTMTMGEGAGLSDDAAWRLFVADIGIANQAWKKAGTRMRRGVEFEKAWTVEMKFQKGLE
jgi:enhancer of mRNA-decapping protein 3